MESPQAETEQRTDLDQEAIRHLLEALGEWGVAEQKGLPDHMVSVFAHRARRAFENLAATA